MSEEKDKKDPISIITANMIKVATNISKEIRASGEEDNCDCPACTLRRKLQSGELTLNSPETKEYLKEIEKREQEEDLKSPFKTAVPESFDVVLPLLIAGEKLVRGDWEDDRFIYFVKGQKYPTQTEVAKQAFGETVQYMDYIAMAIGNKVIPYSPTTEDVLAKDWLILK